MLILGATADDKGHQLESLIRRALDAEGFVRVSGNVVRAGGNELDVTAEREVSVLGSSVITPVMCEAKAYADPVTTPTWQKFLGKLFIERSTSPTTIGTLVALNGVNGNVSGSYADLRRTDPAILLLQGSDLENTAWRNGELASLSDILTLTEEQFRRSPLEAAVAFYGGVHYWVVRWAGTDQYSVVDSRGRMMPSQEVERLRPALEASVSGQLLGTDEARTEAQARHDLRLAAVNRLLRSGGRGTLGVTGKDAELAAVVADEPYCEIHEGSVRLRPPPSLDAPAVSRLFRSMFEDVVRVQRLSFMRGGGHEPFVGRLVDHLAQYQAGFDVTGEDAETLRALAPLFPSVWVTLLSPIEMITNHRQQSAGTKASVGVAADVSDVAAESDRHNFWEAIIHAMETDYSDERLRGLLYDFMDIAELQTSSEFTVKGKRGPIGSPIVTLKRNAVRQFSDGSSDEQASGPVYVLVRLLPSVEQPWESDHPEPEFPVETGID